MNADRERGERGGFSSAHCNLEKFFWHVKISHNGEESKGAQEHMCELVWLQANFRVLYLTKAFSFKEIRSSTDHDVESWVHLHQTK